MFTKRQYAEAMIEKFRRQEGIPESEKLDPYLIRSSTACVAAEYLGLIEDEDVKRYAATRGGMCVGFNFDGTYLMLSTREFLELLPETIEEEEN